MSHPTRRKFVGTSSAVAVVGVMGLAGCRAAHGAPAQSLHRLRLIGEYRLPHKLQYQQTTLGGLSGIDYDPARGAMYLTSDDGGNLSAPRFYTAKLALTTDRLSNIELTGVTFLQGLSAPDPESVRWHAPSQSLLWTSEGNAVRLTQTALHQTRIDGLLMRTFAMPDMFDFGLNSGARINKTLEGLAIALDGLTAWVAMEAALRQDGEEPTVGRPGGPSRLTQIDLTSGKVVKQIAYPLDPIPRQPMPSNANADNGVVEILMLDAHRMLVLERAYMAGLDDRQRNSIRLYIIDTLQATDTIGVAALKPGNHTPAAKTLVADFVNFPALTRLDNTEGMCWGPTLPNGNRSLIFVSDDNFNPRQITQFLAFEFLDRTE